MFVLDSVVVSKEFGIQSEANTSKLQQIEMVTFAMVVLTYVKKINVKMGPNVYVSLILTLLADRVVVIARPQVSQGNTV